MAEGCFMLLLFTVVSCAALEDPKMNISDKCTDDTHSFLWELNQENPKKFAVTMYDSYGRIGSNFFGGNEDQTGMMQECRSVQTTSFSGQFCKVFLNQGNVFYFVGICVPDSCKEKEVHQMVNGGVMTFGGVSLIPTLPSKLVNDSTQSVLRTHCLSKVVNPGTSGITCLVLCLIIVVIPLAATLATAVKDFQGSRKVAPTVEPTSLIMSPTNGDNNLSNCEKNADGLQDFDHIKTKQSCSRRCLQQFLKTFSLQTTTKGLSSRPPSVKGVYNSLTGLRAFSILGIIFGHSFTFPWNKVIDNKTVWLIGLKTNPLVFLAGTIALSVDIFLLLGGLLSAKTLLSSIQRNDDTMSVGLVADYYLKRIIRIQPLHMFVILFGVSVASVINEGPYSWLNEHFMNCEKYWWTNLLLINNLFTVPLSCIPWTWYLSLDMQCFATTPLLILAYRKNKGIFAALVIALLLMSILTSSILTALLHLPVFVSAAWLSPDFANLYYTKPYSRYGTFLIGFLFGMYLKERKEELLKKKWQVALGWTCSLLAMALVIGFYYALVDAPDHPSAPHAIYQGLHRLVWVTAVSWIILACEEGYGGYIMDFLSLNLWVPISNLSFACYLLHPIIVLMYISMQETPIHFSHINLLYLFMGNTLLSFIVSYFANVLVEKPFSLLGQKIRL